MCTFFSTFKPDYCDLCITRLLRPTIASSSTGVANNVWENYFLFKYVKRYTMWDP